MSECERCGRVAEYKAWGTMKKDGAVFVTTTRSWMLCESCVDRFELDLLRWINNYDKVTPKKEPPE